MRQTQYAWTEMMKADPPAKHPAELPRDETMVSDAHPGPWQDYSLPSGARMFWRMPSCTWTYVMN